MNNSNIDLYLCWGLGNFLDESTLTQPNLNKTNPRYIKRAPTLSI